MKTNKSQKEAVLRAHQSIEKNQQDQEKLLHPATPDKKDTTDPATLLNESHQRKVENLHNLRKMDVELARSRKEKE